MIPQPFNKEYVTIKRSEYEALVSIAKTLDEDYKEDHTLVPTKEYKELLTIARKAKELKSNGNAKIDVLHLIIDRARRQRRM